MRDKGLDMGSILEFDPSHRDKRGWKHRIYGFRKMFRDYLNKLNVGFVDECCDEANDVTKRPVVYNETAGRLEYHNGTEYVAVTP